MSESRRKSAVEELNAEGFGTLTAQPPAEQGARGQGVWSRGRWRVVLGRALAGSASDAALAPGGRSQAAFAVWDGGAGDRDGQKAVTDWRPLEQEVERRDGW